MKQNTNFELLILYYRVNIVNSDVLFKSITSRHKTGWYTFYLQEGLDPIYNLGTILSVEFRLHPLLSNFKTASSQLAKRNKPIEV